MVHRRCTAGASRGARCGREARPAISAPIFGKLPANVPQQLGLGRPRIANRTQSCPPGVEDARRIAEAPVRVTCAALAPLLRHPVRTRQPGVPDDEIASLTGSVRSPRSCAWGRASRRFDPAFSPLHTGCGNSPRPRIVVSRHIASDRHRAAQADEVRIILRAASGPTQPSLRRWRSTSTGGSGRVRSPAAIRDRRNEAGRPRKIPSLGSCCRQPLARPVIRPKIPAATRLVLFRGRAGARRSAGSFRR